jgi:hypothetical protein
MGRALECTPPSIGVWWDSLGRAESEHAHSHRANPHVCNEEANGSCCSNPRCFETDNMNAARSPP